MAMPQDARPAKSLSRGERIDAIVTWASRDEARLEELAAVLRGIRGA